MLLKFLIYHRIFPSERKITRIFDIYFEIYFTNCTRKLFLNSESFIKNNQFYSKRPDRQVSELAGCPENGYNRGTGGGNFACPCQHALTQYSRASFSEKRVQTRLPSQPLASSQKYQIWFGCFMSFYLTGLRKTTTLNPISLTDFKPFLIWSHLYVLLFEVFIKISYLVLLYNARQKFLMVLNPTLTFYISR